MGDLTKNFSLDEFLVSEKAADLGIRNTPTATHLKRLKEVTAPGTDNDVQTSCIENLTCYGDFSIRRSCSAFRNACA